jgi:tetratricopeptide (TPR) repeat protein
VTTAERAVELLIGQAREATGEDRYSAALAAADAAVQAAEQLDDPALLVRGLVEEADALHMSGDRLGALARYTRVLGLAEDPATRDRLDHPAATRALARAHMDRVECARFVTGIGARELFGVLDAAESWLSAIGHSDWRAGILRLRALTHQRLGELDAAIATAQEALAVYQPDAPGYTLAAYRWTLGDLLRWANRAGEAEPLYQAILDDPTTGQRDRTATLGGMAWCALAAQEPDTARRHADAAVQLADTLGDVALRTALEVLAAACRAGGDLDSAWQAATRYLDISHRLGGHYMLYYATRDALDIALDRRDQASVDQLLTELAPHASALDTDTNNTTFADEVTQRRHLSIEIEAVERSGTRWWRWHRRLHRG